MMRLKRLQARVVAGMLSASLVTTPHAALAGAATGGATEWTQVLNGIALLQQVVHAIQMVVQLKNQITYWKQTVQALGKSQDPTAMLNAFQNTLGTTRGVLFAAESTALQWQRLSGNTLTGSWAASHPGFKDPKSMGVPDVTAYRQIDSNIQRAVEKTLRTLDAQGDGLENDEAVFKRLQAKVSGEGELSEDDKVKGQLQAAMLANELLLEILRQLQLTRQVLQVHAHMMAAQVSGDAQRRQFDDVIRHRDPGYSAKYRGSNSQTLGGAQAATSLAGGVKSLAQGGSSLTGAGEVVQLASGAASPSPGGSYVTEDGRTVQLAPGATSPSPGGSYVTEDGRTVQLAPGAASPSSDDSYVTEGGRTVQFAPGATSPSPGGSYVTEGGRTVQLAPRAPQPLEDDGTESDDEEDF